MGGGWVGWETMGWWIPMWCMEAIILAYDNVGNDVN